MNTIIKSLLVAGALAVSTLAVTSHVGATSTANSCVDGKKQSNLVVAWKNNGEVTVGTVNNKPLCEDVNLYFSSYVMPDNYNGKPFGGNATATPQTIFGNTAATLKKGATAPIKMTVKLPEACKNIQVDVYYPPKIETVSKAGHGSQYITGKMLTKTVKSCTVEAPAKPVTPVVPKPEAQTPAAPKPVVTVPTVEATPVVEATPKVTMPTELPATGSEVLKAVSFGAVVSATAYAATYLATKRR